MNDHYPYNNPHYSNYISCIMKDHIKSSTTRDIGIHSNNPPIQQLILLPRYARYLEILQQILTANQLAPYLITPLILSIMHQLYDIILEDQPGIRCEKVQTIIQAIET